MKKCLNFWRPANSGKGAACFLEFNEGTLWMSFMPQGGADGKKFDKSKKINAKLSTQDIGEFLAVINGRREGLGTKNEKGYFSGLVHKIRDSKNSSIIGLSPSDTGYFLSLSAVREGQENQRLSVGLSGADMEVLGVFLRTVLVELFDKEPVEATAEPVNA